MNLCCEIHKNNEIFTEFILSCFDKVSRAFIGNGEIHNKITAIYLSATRCQTILLNGETLSYFYLVLMLSQKANELGLIIGVALFISNFSGPTFKFSTISNPNAWNTCLILLIVDAGYFNMYLKYLFR